MPAKRSESAIPAASLALYEKYVAGLPGIERKGATLPYTSVNGNMFSFLSADGSIALRLSRAAREAFLKEHPDAVCIAHGVVMKEYITVPRQVLVKASTLKKLFAASHAYALSLKPKKTTRGNL